MKTYITLFLSLLLAVSVSQAQVVVTSTDNFSTRDQMLLANEINESGLSNMRSLTGMFLLYK